MILFILIGDVHQSIIHCLMPENSWYYTKPSITIIFLKSDSGFPFPYLLPPAGDAGPSSSNPGKYLWKYARYVKQGGIGQ